MLSPSNRTPEQEARFQEELAARQSVKSLARNQWPEILTRLGVNPVLLRKKKGQWCPFCKDGRDRYAFIDKDGDGFWMCRKCPPPGNGDGITFVMRYFDLSWWRATGEVLRVLGDPTYRRLEDHRDERIAQARQRQSQTEFERHRARRIEAWNQALRVVPGDPVYRWLMRRVPGLKEVPNVIRFHPALDYYRAPAVDQGEPDRPVFMGRFAAMLAAVQGPDGTGVNIHRTYLTEDGEKARIVDPWGEFLDVRKSMAGGLPNGYAIRLASGQHRELGIGEGIETSLNAGIFSGIPTWSVLSTAGMMKFVIPDWVERLTVFADNDEPDSKGNLPGFKAAECLQKRPDVVARVKQRTLRVIVRTTAKRGTDFADLGEKLAATEPVSQV